MSDLRPAPDHLWACATVAATAMCVFALAYALGFGDEYLIVSALCSIALTGFGIALGLTGRADDKR